MKNEIQEYIDKLSVHDHNAMWPGFWENLKTKSQAICDALTEIEKVACGEEQIECDGAYADSDGLQWIYKKIQTLKGA